MVCPCERAVGIDSCQYVSKGAMVHVRGLHTLTYHEYRSNSTQLAAIVLQTEQKTSQLQSLSTRKVDFYT